jgi:hypothetical protein
MSYNFWVFEGKKYNLTEFSRKHPGGEYFILRTAERDITLNVNLYHKNVEKIKKILEKYEIKEKDERKLSPTFGLGVPKFLFEEGYDVSKEKYPFDSKSELQSKVIQRIYGDEKISKEVIEMDKNYEIFSWVVFLVHILLFILFTYKRITMFLSVPIMVLTRNILSGFGHYGIHKALPNIYASWFDINYVGNHFVATDGHTLIHHVHTQMGGDVKK